MYSKTGHNILKQQHHQLSYRENIKNDRTTVFNFRHLVGDEYYQTFVFPHLSAIISARPLSLLQFEFSNSGNYSFHISGKIVKMYLTYLQNFIFIDRKQLLECIKLLVYNNQLHLKVVKRFITIHYRDDSYYLSNQNEKNQWHKRAVSQNQAKRQIGRNMREFQQVVSSSSDNEESDEDDNITLSDENEFNTIIKTSSNMKTLTNSHKSNHQIEKLINFIRILHRINQNHIRSKFKSLPDQEVLSDEQHLEYKDQLIEWYKELKLSRQYLYMLDEDNFIRIHDRNEIQQQWIDQVNITSDFIKDREQYLKDKYPDHEIIEFDDDFSFFE